MAGPKASMTWWSFVDRGVSADDLIRAVASIGYDGIELADEALWPAIAEAGLRIVSHRGHGTIESGLNRAEDKRPKKPLTDRIKERLRDLVDEVLGTLEELAHPTPMPVPIPVRTRRW